MFRDRISSGIIQEAGEEEAEKAEAVMGGFSVELEWVAVNCAKR